MPRKRNTENKGLPARWKYQHGAYYYRVPPGLEAMWDGKQFFRLGETLPAVVSFRPARLPLPCHRK